MAKLKLYTSKMVSEHKKRKAKEFKVCKTKEKEKALLEAFPNYTMNIYMANY